MSREIDFNRSLVELINDVRYGWRQNAVNLGGTTGSGGGSGAPPGGFIGQLPQSQVTGDTSELRTLHSGSIASLVDNLDRIRYWETVQISGSAPSPTFAGQIWIDGSSGSAINIRNESDTGWITFSSGGGGVPLDASSPQDIGNSAAVGTSGSAAHGDHVHRGVHSISKYAGTFSYGDVVLVPGTGISIDQSSGSFTINSANGTVLDSTSPADVASSAVVGTSGSAAHGDHVHRGVHSLSAQGNAFIYGDAVLVAGSGVTLSQSSGSVTIAAPAGGVTLDDTSPVDVGSSAVAGTSGSAARGDHVHRGLHAIYSPGNSFAYGDIALVAGSNVTITQSSGSFTIASTGSGGSGTPGGADTQVQFNDAGAFNGSANFTWNNSSNILGLSDPLLGTLSFNGSKINGAAPNGITLSGGNGSGIAGGPIQVSAGNSTGSNAGGGVTFSAGDSSTGSAGNVVFSGGDGVVAGNIAFIPGTTGSVMFRRHSPSIYAVFDLNSLTSSNKVFRFPNASGTFALTSDLASYQPLSVTLTSLSALADSSGWLHNDGAGVLAWTTPAGGIVLDDTSPVDIGSSAAAGTSGSAAHGDHVHRGVHSVMKSGGVFAFGDIVFVPGVGISIDQSSGSFTINSANGTVLDATSPADIAASAVVGTSGSAAHGDHTHRGLHAIYAPGNSFAFGDIALIAGSNITVTQSSGSFTIAGTGGGGGGSLDSTNPVDVGSSAVVGTSGSAAHGDHVHRGVHSVSTPGGSFAYGDTVLVAGANVTVTQSSGSFTITSTGGGMDFLIAQVFS